MDSSVLIGELPIPARLIQLIRAGKWVPPSDDVLLEVFAEEPVQPQFYGEGMLIRENQAWRAYPENAWPGNPDIEGNLGIAAERSMVIADLGPEMPIVLDYRKSLTSPRVIYMRASSWVQVAENFEDLIERLYPNSL
ncbi:hypothetical protein ABZT04_41740 [Streptomyces sp. NPDC005492]|uniref:hypothetical protein n=1 Tax=Streptomyces sp. NPDC005492 TaxID=3156883 RepID=UPI0033B7EB5B